MIGLNVPVSMKCKTDKPDRHKDGSGHHHPMGVFPIEQQVEHFGHSLFPLRLPDGEWANLMLIKRARLRIAEGLHLNSSAIIAQLSPAAAKVRS
jgi:hypothetical protein